jgi:hypothetical protein
MNKAGWNGRGRFAAPMVACAVVVMLALAIPARGQEITVQNDSFESGGPTYVVGNFVAGEQAGVRLTSPCDGSIVAVQIGWLSVPGDTLPSVEEAIHIYDGSTFPAPGSELLTLAGPVLTDEALNEFRYIDDQQMIPIDVPVSAGQQFYVTLEFANPTNIDPNNPDDPNYTASVFRDLGGCQGGKNVLYAIPGGWLNFCILISGDLVIRAVVDCGELSGACCLPDGSCTEVTPSECAASDGDYQGDLTDCGSVSCPEPEGACCIEATGGCLNLIEDHCAIVGGIWSGWDTDCATYVCFPIGACCLPDGSCQDELSPEDCAALEGVFQGDGTDCATVDCPEPEGACCFAGGGCLVLTEGDCAIGAGAWMGGGTDCTDGDQNGTADACESSTCAGDTDHDGDVDLGDLAQLLGHYGETSGVGWEEGDFDGDGDVDLSDLAALLGNYGGACP